jgi:hypothetical protein
MALRETEIMMFFEGAATLNIFYLILQKSLPGKPALEDTATAIGQAVITAHCSAEMCLI